MRGKFSFPKKHRLTGKTQIDELFTKGSSFFCYPFKVVYLLERPTLLKSNQVLISVPKKHWKRAVDRNLIRRRVREAYRQENQPLQTDQTTILPTRRIVGFIYTAKVLHSYSEICKSMASILRDKKLHIQDLPSA
jgi:ribonuclease P protein component